MWSEGRLKRLLHFLGVIDATRELDHEGHWWSMYDEPWELESLRRSLVVCAPEGPATSLTNGDAGRLISRLQAAEDELEMLRSAVAALLHDMTPHRSPAPTHTLLHRVW